MSEDKKDENGYLIMPEHMLKECYLLFKSHGVRNQSMDEIASVIGVSKKKLYQYVSNKGELVAKTTAYFIEELKDAYNQAKESENAIEELFSILGYFAETFENIHENTLSDIKRYYPKAWNLYMTHQQEYSQKALSENIDRGMKEGYFRKEVDRDFIVPVFFNILVNSIDRKEMSMDTIPVAERIAALCNYHVHGIATSEGIELHDTYVKSKEHFIAQLK